MADMRAISHSALARAPDVGLQQVSPIRSAVHCNRRRSHLNASSEAAFFSYSRWAYRSKERRRFAPAHGSVPADESSSTRRPIRTLGSVPADESSSTLRPIRTLLIDNYDSYTYNLYQLLSVINGAPPRVIKNDEVSWDDLRRILYEENAFDNIVISPGPGSPMCGKDIGVCLQVLQECIDIPILGVCLGHQALGYVNGAKVVHAVDPIHGRLSEVEHTDCPFFKDIPSGRGSGFQVVRYHSLMLAEEAFPEDLIPTAWTLNSCGSLSLEALALIERESATATGDGNFRVVLGQNNARRFHLCENGTGSDSIAHKHTYVKTSVLAGDENESTVMNDRIVEHKNKARVIMAVSHRKRPHYGVQFHPESVATSFGIRMLENFRDITLKYWKDRGISRCIKVENLVKGHVLEQSISEDACSCADSRGGPLRLYWEKADGVAIEAGGSEGIFCGLFGEGTAKDTFWLDSSLQPEGACFSFMGGKGGRLWKRLTYSMSNISGRGVLRIEDNKHVEEIQIQKGFMEFLGTELESFTISKVDKEGLPFDFWGGYVGYLGYELKAECGASYNKHKSKLPDACYFFVDRFVAVDHSNNDVYAVVLYKEAYNTGLESFDMDKERIAPNSPSEVLKGTGSSGKHMLQSVASMGNGSTSTATLTAQMWVKEMLRKVNELVEGGRDMSVERRYSSQLASSSLGGISTDSHFVIAKSRKQYMEDVRACLAYIRDGESYELCLTTQLQKRVNSLDALSLYLTLRKMNPAPYAAWLHFGQEELCICCSSPERFLRLDQNGVIEAKPIKGTIPRGRSPAEDEALKSKLQYSEKDQAENLMIVDLLRNDLGQVCQPGTVHVPRLMAVESYATVHTMVSTVRGLKRSDVTSMDCVRASFPGGSMTGAPKLRSMELLDSLECSPRGVYSGCIGFFSVNSSFDLNIVIRTLVIHKGVASLGAGGAIVALSDPGDEYEEMLLKTNAPLQAVSQHETLTNLSSQELENGSLPHALLGLH